MLLEPEDGRCDLELGAVPAIRGRSSGRFEGLARSVQTGANVSAHTKAFGLALLARSADGSEVVKDSG